jgi:hypothetical protein
VTYHGYLLAMDMAMRLRMPSAHIRFDPERATWQLGEHEVRANEVSRTSVRFQLFTVGDHEQFVGSYSGTIGATPQEIAQYLVYFLDAGKPWHHGLGKKGLF